MNNSSIFVLIGITDLDFSNPAYFLDFLGSTRCIGWYFSLDDAEKVILQDTHHSHRFFNWFVIEETKPGFFSKVVSRTCYHWNENSNCYEKVIEPDCLTDYPNLGLG